jgi:Tat protein translocase TatB subunit
MGLGLGELLLLAFIGILFLKPAELRRTAKMIGGWMAEMRKMSQEFTRELSREVDFSEIQRVKTDIESRVKRELDGVLTDSPEPGAKSDPATLTMRPHNPFSAESASEPHSGGNEETSNGVSAETGVAPESPVSNPQISENAREVTTADDRESDKVAEPGQ